MYLESGDGSGASRVVPPTARALQARELLRLLVRAAGIGWALVFVAVGIGAELQLYADGSLFSYAVAAESGWAFHWHNISGRILVYLLVHMPAEAYVALTNDAAGGIAVYGLLFFSAPLIGLAATWLIDETSGRSLFTGACLSTACLCPLVFGFPTEMWVAHSLFWPTLALARGARRGIARSVLLAVAMLALVLTHEGAVVLAVSIVAIVMLVGTADDERRRAVTALAVALAVWAMVKAAMPPDPYFSAVLARAALAFIDVTGLVNPVMVAIAAGVAGWSLVALAAHRLDLAGGTLVALACLALAGGAYWLWHDGYLLADDRYTLRTALLIATPVLGLWASARAADSEARLSSIGAVAAGLARRITRTMPHSLSAGALAAVTLVHVVETVEFVTAWEAYKSAVARLATSALSDPWLGDSRFASALRLGDDANRMSWHSTTQYLSILVAPGMRPRRLVVHPDAGYHWMTCRTAAESEQREGAIPWESRRLIMIHACQHRRF